MRIWKKINFTKIKWEYILSSWQGGDNVDIKQLRELSGLKTSKVCEELDISRTQLYNLENKVCKMDRLKIEKLSFLYRVTEEEIIKALEV